MNSRIIEYHYKWKIFQESLQDLCTISGKNLAKSCKKLGKIMHGLILPRCLATYYQDLSIMQDHARDFC